ncbi:hypothetical protein [Aquipseudomonas campi]
MPIVDSAAIMLKGFLYMMSSEQRLNFLLEKAARHEKAILIVANKENGASLLSLNLSGYVQAISTYCLMTSVCLDSYARALEKFNVVEKFESLLMLRQDAEPGRNHFNYTAEDVDIIAVVIALGRFDLAIAYLRDVLATVDLNPLWSAYVMGLSSWQKSAEFYWSSSKPKGMQKHWMLYIEFMKLSAQEQDTHVVVQEIAQSFLRCNGDKRLVEITHIDPSGTFPISWDLRLAYIVELARYTAGR